ncbi:MAG: SHOCT domain-containing protein [Actinomycetota bacterium]|nr:SHOCT domain-containing protein [Actinomycetota bacterium]
MEPDGGMMNMMAGMMGGWMLLWALVGLALLALVVVATIWLAKRVSPSSSASEGPDAVLQRRYAAGEIDRDEFLRVQRDLSGR